MRSTGYFGLMLFVFHIAFSAAGKTVEHRYVVPTKDNVPVYTTRMHGNHESAGFHVSMQDRLTVVSESRRRFKVRDSRGKVGWVDKSKVTKVSPSKRFVFGNADVHGYLDDPSPIYIIDADGPDNVTLKLDRSFDNALRQNADKYSIERATENESAKFNF